MRSADRQQPNPTKAPKVRFKPARDANPSLLMKRPARPEEVAPANVFLAAPSCSSYISGEILPVLGGNTTG
jgi:NAD(P)-dependent dehydrogenase (short-subunit alcohol dehydrogenase family)